jgi:hypothetical protein
LTKLHTTYKRTDRLGTALDMVVVRQLTSVDIAAIGISLCACGDASGALDAALARLENIVRDVTG